VAEDLTENELISLASLLIIAGFETTSNLIGNAMIGLFAHPDQLDLLRRDPGLLPAAVDELIRFDGPAHMATFRFTAEPVEFSGTTIPAGEVVMLSLLAANRDEDQFTEPDQVDLRRRQNTHVGFGRGIHFCIGAALARAEGEIMLGKLLSRFPAIRLAVPADEIPWQFTLLTRGAERLQVVLG
jgi:cytochrome P450